MNKVSNNKKNDRLIITMGLLMIISVITFFGSGFIMMNTSSYDYDETMTITLITLISFVVSVVLFIVLMNVCGKEMEEEKGSWLERAFRDKNIKKDDIKFNLKKSAIGFINKELLYTNDKRLFYLEINKNANENKISEIKLNDILKLDLECTTMEHNRKRIIALTTTYDNIKSITDVQIKIITDYRIYSIELDKTKESVDKATQFKLTLDRELKALNK